MKRQIKHIAILILLSMLIGACSDWKFHYRRQNKINFYSNKVEAKQHKS